MDEIYQIVPVLPVQAIDIGGSKTLSIRIASRYHPAFN